MDGSYHLIVRLVARTGCEEALEADLVELAEASRATPGCIRFVVTRSLEARGELWLFEGFLSRAAYDDHVGTPHAQRFLRETLPDLVASREVLTSSPGSAP